MIKTCRYCGKEFETKKGHNNQIYCCKSCSIKDRHEEDVGLFRADAPDFIQKYILGLIITDGCISKSGNNKYICISLKDKEMIDKIRCLVCPNKKIYKDGDNSQVKWRNKKDIEYLASLGIGERKTYTVELPMLQNNMWHMIRGICDGDGCVYKSTTIDKKFNKEYTYTYVSFTTGSKNLANQLNEYLLDNGISSRISVDGRDGRANDAFYVRVTTKSGVNALRDFMYKDCEDWFLERKYKKFF